MANVQKTVHVPALSQENNPLNEKNHLHLVKVCDSWEVASDLARELSIQHREPVTVRREGGGWGLFVADEVACLFRPPSYAELYGTEVLRGDNYGGDPRWQPNDAILDLSDDEAGIEPIGSRPGWVY